MESYATEKRGFHITRIIAPAVRCEVEGIRRHRCDKCSRSGPESEVPSPGGNFEPVATNKKKAMRPVPQLAKRRRLRVSGGTCTAMSSNGCESA